MRKRVELLILTMETDPSGYRLEEAALESGVKFDYRYYRDLVGVESLGRQGTRLMARRPYATNDLANNYFGLFRQILKINQFDWVMDAEFYHKDYLYYEDKWGKQAVMESLGLPVAELVAVESHDWRFPLIAKKRFAGRSYANFVLTSKADWQRFERKHEGYQFVFQRYWPLRADYRLMVLGDKVLGMIEREVKFGRGGQVKVRGVGKVYKWAKALDQAGLTLKRALRVDFLGVDLGIKEDGNWFVMEYNWSPQFLAFERETGMDVAGQVIEYCLKV